MKDKILTKLRDSITQVIIGVIGIVVAIIFFILQTNTKSLSYEVISNNQIVSINEEAREQIEILFEGKRVENVNLLILEITNDGDIPIIKSDYESPITIKTNSEGRILSAEAIGIAPSNLTIPISISYHTISLKEVLLNPGDKFRIKILLDRSIDDPEILSRIIGISNIEKVRSSKSFMSYLWNDLGSAIISLVLMITVISMGNTVSFINRKYK